METKNNIFKRYLKEYLQAHKDRKSEILNHIVDVIGIHRKAAIRKFKHLQMNNPNHSNKRGRRTYYTKDVDGALYDVWEAANRPCGELLFPLIRDYIPILQRDDMWNHDDIATAKLFAMKKRTVRRRCETFKRKHGVCKGKSATKPSHLKSIIPIYKGSWSTFAPGNGQLDTVAHCGNSLIGDYVYTLNYTDAATYWINLRAQWNKGAEATTNSLSVIYERFPTQITHVHPDTVSEFINWTMKPWCDENNIKMTRSEPGRSNDNMHVEERNGHVVRKYLGYTRFDCKETVDLINELYDILGLYLNHFQAVRRTISKERVGAKYKRVYEKIAKTPYQRMIESDDIDYDTKLQLRFEHAQLNPLVLKKKIDIITKKIIKKQCDYDILK